MKSIFYLSFSIVVCILFSTSLYGQRYSIGLSSGSTFFTQKAEMEDEYIGEPFYRNGLIVQGDFMMHLNNNIGIKLGVAYEQKEFYRRQIFNFGEGAYEFEFNYLSFPLITELSFGQKIKMKAHGGVSIEYLLKHIWVRQTDIAEWRESDKTKEYERIYYSALAGLVVEIPLSDRLSIELGGRCSIGLKTLQKTRSWVMFKYFGFVTSVGVRYSLGKI